LSATIDHVSIYRENLFIFTGLCQLPCIDHVSIYRENLFIFTGLCQLPLITTLVQIQQADIELCNSKGMTPLMIAAQTGNSILCDVSIYRTLYRGKVYHRIKYDFVEIY
jgi:hypothetical protein